LAKIIPNSYSINWLNVITAPKANRKKLAAGAEEWKILDKDVAESVLNKILDFEETPLTLPAYQSFIKKFPKKNYYKWKLALYYNKSKQCGKAIAIADDILLDEMATQRAGFLDIKGHCQLKARDYDGAMSTFEQFIGIKPEDWLGYFNLGNVHERQGNRDKAVNYFKRALEKNPPAQYISRLKGKIKRNSKK